MFFGSEAPAEWKKHQPLNHKDSKHFHVVVKTYLEYSPVALAYTTLARGSLFCSCITALPILVDVAFLALWHSSNTICKHGAVKGIYSDHPEMCNTHPVFKSSHSSIRYSENSNSKGYDTIKIRSTPIQDLLESSAMLASCLALSNQSRVGSKQNTFWGSCVSILYLTGHNDTQIGEVLIGNILIQSYSVESQNRKERVNVHFV